MAKTIFIYSLTQVTYLLISYLLTYLLTPRCRVLLEKLNDLQLVKKFPAFHGTRRFITALTSVRHLSLSWATPIRSIYPHSTSCRSVLILSTHLRLGLPSGSFPPVSPPRPYTPLSSTIRATRPPHTIKTLLHVSFIRSSSGSILCSLVKLQLKNIQWFTSLRWVGAVAACLVYCVSCVLFRVSVAMDVCCVT